MPNRRKSKFSVPDKIHMAEALDAICNSVGEDTQTQLTEDTFMAAVSIRMEIGILAALEKLILTGQLDAEPGAGVSEKPPLRVEHYLFSGVPQEEQAQRLKAFKSEPKSNTPPLA
jgi:hypothetical protein